MLTSSNMNCVERAMLFMDHIHPYIHDTGQWFFFFFFLCMVSKVATKINEIFLTKSSPICFINIKLMLKPALQLLKKKHIFAAGFNKTRNASRNISCQKLRTKKNTHFFWKMVTTRYEEKFVAVC